MLCFYCWGVMIEQRDPICGIAKIVTHLSGFGDKHPKYYLDNGPDFVGI